MGTRSESPHVRRAVTVAIAVLAVLALGSLDLRALPPSAASWSIPLAPSLAGSAALDEVDGADWQSNPIRADVTLSGLSWDGAAPTSASIRGRSGDGEWSPWTPIVIDAEHGPDPGTDEFRDARSASEPVYLGPVEWVQFRVESANVATLSAEFVETAGRHRSLVQRASDFLRRVTFSAVDADAAPDRPTFVGRDVWGGDQCLGADPHEPRYTDGVEVMFVHHTATANSYGAADAADIVYSICNYHVNTNGWRDIGYNFLIDKFGTVYEGRAGGVDAAVWGGHTGGFNYYSTGVALIGDHNSAAVTQSTLDALQELAAWKLDLHHVDPTGSIVIESLGSTKYDQGVLVDMPRLAGHLDASSTSCPGTLCYPLLSDYRPIVLETGGPKILGGRPDVNPPVVGRELEFAFELTTASEWEFALSGLDGTTIHEASGSGTSATVTWDGMFDGNAIESGDYVVSITATPDAGAPPTSVERTYEFYRPPYRDDDASVHEDAIIAIADAEITQGCSDFFDWWFCPEDSVTRDQMASFIARALDLPDSETDHFADDNGNTHEASINALADAGITLGCGALAYCPRLPITRAEMAAFLARALDLPGTETDHFADVSGHRHEDAINAIAEAGITLGCRDGVFCPNDSVVRGQMASFLTRAFLTPG